MKKIFHDHELDGVAPACNAPGSALQKQKQGDHKFKASQVHIVVPGQPGLQRESLIVKKPKESGMMTLWLSVL